MGRVRGLLIVGKEVWGIGRIWMRRVNVGISGRLLIVGDFGKLWMQRVSVGIIETERCI